jgi:glycosyltransferase involved in cell wall biosynthesis
MVPSVVTRGNGSPERPLVSVIVPVYNRADVLGETLDSVLAQTYPNIELIVVDDGSKDDTPAVMARYAGRLIAIHQQNQGLAAARNIGFARSRGKYVAWLDHDDVWMPEKISLQVAFMEQHPDVAITATDFSAFDESGYFERSHIASYYSAVAKGGLGRIFERTTRLDTRAIPELAAASELPASMPVHLGRIHDKLIWGNCMHPPTVMMTRAAHEQAGVCDGRFGNDVDYEFIMRVSKHGSAALIDHPLIRYRYSEGQLSGDRNLAKIALSLITTLEALSEREPGLREDPRFRRRLAVAHQDAANALADSKRGPALRHLVRSVGGGVVDSKTARVLAKLALPRLVVDRYRTPRSKSSK